MCVCVCVHGRCVCVPCVCMRDTVQFKSSPIISKNMVLIFSLYATSCFAPSRHHHHHHHHHCTHADVRPHVPEVFHARHPHPLQRRHPSPSGMCEIVCF